MILTCTSTVSFNIRFRSLKLFNSSVIFITGGSFTGLITIERDKDLVRISPVVRLSSPTLSALICIVTLSFPKKS